MLDLLSTDLNRIHPIVVAFPLALLVVSVLLDLIARFRPALRAGARLTLYLGTLGAVIATITGLITHLRYEGTPVAGFIDQHEFIAYTTTAIFLALSIWRSRAMRRGSDVGGSWVYVAFSVAGLLALVLTGALGGNLVFGHGVGISH
jgi:uncharacterized membrane protein